MNGSPSEDDEHVRIVLLGGPGSGKGTQGPALAAALRIPYLATGDLVRAEVQRDSQLGRRLAEIANVGGLVPDGLIIEVLDQPLAAAAGQGGWVLDGFPRTEAQFDALRRRVGAVDAAVYLRVDVEELRHRLVVRSHEQNRVDDRNEHVVDRRMAEFVEQTLPVVEHYRQAGLLIEIDGAGDPEEIGKRILQAIT